MTRVSGRGYTVRGKTLRSVLFILFAACAKFAQQSEGSGAFLAADNYYMSPPLLLCLARHTAFGLGTVKRNRIGISEAFKFWGKEGIPLENPGRSLPSWSSGTPKMPCPTGTCTQGQYHR